MSNESAPQKANDSVEERRLPMGEPRSPDAGPAETCCIACDYDLRGSITAQCPECGFVQPAGAVAPGVPVAVRLERSPASVAAAIWLMRSPERAIGAAATMTLPFRPIAGRLLPILALMMVLARLLLTVVFIELNGSQFGGRVLGDAVYSGLAAVADVLLGIGGTYLLAIVLLAWWRTPRRLRRPLDLASVLYCGVTFAALTTALLRTGNMITMHFDLLPRFAVVGMTGLWELIAFVEYGLAWLWCRACTEPVTPPADRSAVAILIGAVMLARWSIENWIATAAAYLWFWLAQLAVEWL
ncbi:MAG: hypothetical protein SF069_02800 [Phycisphaerae bacterium]|nr:hypothetical protein [Phycisphaerae bacterium]